MKLSLFKIIIIVTISFIRSVPLENTMAFGGVATGNIKANDVAMAVGIIRYKGFT